MVLVVIGVIALAGGTLLLITEGTVPGIVLLVFGVVMLGIGIRMLLRHRET